MAIHELKEQIGRLPEQPGVYLYFNAEGDTIYVGKARSLRARVRNYLGAYGSDPKTDALLDEVVELDIIVTDSVVEALALENNLIKQRTPKYNICLLYTSDAADDLICVDLGGRRIIKKTKNKEKPSQALKHSKRSQYKSKKEL